MSQEAHEQHTQLKQENDELQQENGELRHRLEEASRVIAGLNDELDTRSARGMRNVRGTPVVKVPSAGAGDELFETIWHE